ncbi:glucan biosynthesis protein [Enterovirga rhinocerotis]|uniref:Glucans biosynthesis protein n=1 Tax=Enterovirga rhinocerotis TaxID=1339210 RepID=A0A4V3DYS1_9HYPH|nr:glucan biosynthesis protein D [Enterovirga rhinocerotis]TDR93749.1 glucans biosynthesis protein [Enterovirga rhinocerotis]
MIDRRLLLRSAAAATAGLAASGFSREAMAQAGLVYGPAAPFSFDRLKEDVRRMARSAYAAPQPSEPDVLFRIDYDEHGKIKYKTDLALWANGPSAFPVTFFHLGRFFQKPVRMHVVQGGQAKEILYDEAYFDMPADSPAHELPKNSGFAGFRFQERRDGKLDWRNNDWVAFLGASYFRAIGENFQYGISARAIAIDTVVHGKQEEFPDFTRFWFETPDAGSDTVVVYALMDGPSVVGAYRFTMTRDARVTIDVESMIVLRRDVSRLGIAALTSMYWFSETAKPTMIDWRPEVHDSDGLAMWTGAGERIWRPLNNPPATQVSAFADRSPRGFGLLQRDRDFNNYLDGVYYDRRPCLWVEPRGDWGQGSVQLVENPTDDEIHDNIVAMWVPAEPATGGRELSFAYRTVWASDEPNPTPLARVVATRLGNGGQAGTDRPKGMRKFLVEFLGGPLKDLPAGVMPEPVVTASRGTFSNIRPEAVPNDVQGHWRVQFDLLVEGHEPVEIRCFLRGAAKDGGAPPVLSETWLYQYHPQG